MGPAAGSRAAKQGEGSGARGAAQPGAGPAPRKRVSLTAKVKGSWSKEEDNKLIECVGRAGGRSAGQPQGHAAHQKPCYAQRNANAGGLCACSAHSTLPRALPHAHAQPRAPPGRGQLEPNRARAERGERYALPECSMGRWGARPSAACSQHALRARAPVQARPPATAASASSAGSGGATTCAQVREPGRCCPPHSPTYQPMPHNAGDRVASFMPTTRPTLRLVVRTQTSRRTRGPMRRRSCWRRWGATLPRCHGLHASVLRGGGG